MKQLAMSALLSLAALSAQASELIVKEAQIPLAPPGVMTHAAYFTLVNAGEVPRHLVGVRAEGYAMAHLHMSQEMDGVATMAAMHEVEIAPGQTVRFERGGLHVMLMHPKAMRAEGDEVPLTLVFANGEEIEVMAVVRRFENGA